MSVSSAQPKKKNIFIWIIGGAAALCVVCLVLGVVVGAFSGGTKTASTNQGASNPAGEPQAAAQNSDAGSAPESNSAPASPAGESRENPVPFGTAATFDNMTVTITDVVRPADDVIAAADFNIQPEANQEYLMMSIQAICNKSTSETCSFMPSEFKAVGSNGNVSEEEIMVTGIDGHLQSGEFFGGSTKEGKLFFLVPKGDAGVVAFYDPLLFGDPVYLSINK